MSNIIRVKLTAWIPEIREPRQPRESLWSSLDSKLSGIVPNTKFILENYNNKNQNMMHTDLQVSWFIIFKKAPSCVGVYLMFFWNVESLAD